jgi:hypothetical protein
MAEKISHPEPEDPIYEDTEDPEMTIPAEAVPSTTAPQPPDAPVERQGDADAEVAPGEPLHSTTAPQPDEDTEAAEAAASAQPLVGRDTVPGAPTPQPHNDPSADPVLAADLETEGAAG